MKEQNKWWEREQWLQQLLVYLTRKERLEQLQTFDEASEEIKVSFDDKQFRVANRLNRIHQLQEWSADLPIQNKPLRKWYRQQWVAIAASLFLVVTLGALAYWITTKESLFEQYVTFQELEYTKGTMGSNDQEMKRTQAYNLFRVKQYEEAATTFDALSETACDDSDWLYWGYALIRSSDEETAIRRGINYLELYQENVVEMDISEDELNWYRALGYLKLKDRSALGAIHEELSDGKYKNQLTELLNRLN